MANHGEGSAARSVPHLHLCAGGTPLWGGARPIDEGFQRLIACRAEKPKTFARGSSRIMGGADALLWGVETPKHTGLVPSDWAPDSSIYGRGAVGACPGLPA
ncbi:hypothetical protein KUG47_16330 [Falsochrobactrum sp. TDYN1]|uniref:Uncharacterized protein n=1 Tax=Falsochrobactrum tianjinense TaxID=2706015 RepID=A0A949UUD3_9HYPH|nr:hypothetical protein [Falsochrobactrum sp. TDYN1]